MSKRVPPTTDNTRSKQQLNNIILSNVDNELCVSTRTIAEGAEVKHQAVVNLINKHRSEIEKHGNHVVFKIRDKSKTGREKEAFLNEAQAALLMMLLKNTTPVIQFKSNLVEAYTRQRKQHEKLIKAHATLEYQQNKEMGILHRRDLTDEIKPFIEYAKAKGSKGSHFLYSNITKWINKSCNLKSVKDADEIELANVSTACDIAMTAINHGMTNNDCYKAIKATIKANLDSYALLIKGRTQ